MRYIINNNIKYHEDRSELVSLHDDIPPITLTATLNRLLSALVRNNNLVLSRDALLAQVWEAHGQVASGNNLNNTISILRKAFSSLGEEEIIVTLPRQGFMFTAATIKTADSQAPAELEPTGEAVMTEPGEQAVAPAVWDSGARFKRFGIMALSILALGSGIWAWQSTGYPPLSAVDVGRIGKCEVKFMTAYHKVGSGAVDLTHLQRLLEQRTHTQCQEPATILYYDSSSLTPGDKGRVRSSFFYYCPQDKMQTGKVQCESIYESKSE